MSGLASIASRRPDNAEHHVVQITDALQTQLAIRLASIVPGNKVTVEEPREASEVDVVDGQVAASLFLIP